MKKLLLTIALMSALCVQSLSAQIVKGDMNDDGKIDVDDLNETVNTVLGFKPLQYIQSLVVKGDMNDDCKIDVSDINEIVNTILGNSPLRYIHEYVDLGLPSGTLWATTNIGADCPEDFGLYFAWGETTGYAGSDYQNHPFKWDNYKWMIPGKASWEYVTKYTCSDGSTGMSWYSNGEYVGSTIDGVTYKELTELLPEDDAATANWGSGWRMPSKEQLLELRNSNYTTIEWTTENEVEGIKITSKRNGNSIFLPAAGWRYGTEPLGFVESAYWSRSLYLNGSYNAWYLKFASGYINMNMKYRYQGRSVRPVRVTTAQ